VYLEDQKSLYGVLMPLKTEWRLCYSILFIYDNWSVAVELAGYVEWFLTSTQAEADAKNHLMVPVSPVVVNRIRTIVLERMTCNGQPLMDLVRHQKYEEEESLKTWKLPVLIVTPLIAVVIFVLIVYAIRQRVQYLRTLDRDDWKINFFDIDFVVPKKSRRTVSNSADTDEDLAPSSKNSVGRWNIHEVVTRPLSIARVFDVNRKVKQTLMFIRERVGHENVNKFFGISSANDAVYLVEQYCANGTLVETSWSCAAPTYTSWSSTAPMARWDTSRSRTEPAVPRFDTSSSSTAPTARWWTSSETTSTA